MKPKVLRVVSHFMSNSATLWTAACQAPLSLGFPRQEYWSGLPALLQGIFLTQGIDPASHYVSWIDRQVFYH